MPNYDTYIRMYLLVTVSLKLMLAKVSTIDLSIVPTYTCGNNLPELLGLVQVMIIILIKKLLHTIIMHIFFIDSLTFIINCTVK